MKKAFLFFSAQYLPTAGGVERYTCNLGRRLVEMGHRVTVVTSALPGLPRHETGEDGIEIYRFPSWLLMGGRFPVLKPCSRLTRELFQNHFDCCIINTYFYPMSIYAAFQCRRRGIPAIVINHGSAWLMTGSPLLQLMGRIYERCAAGLVHSRCPRFFGVSGAALDWLNTFRIRGDGIITNAVDPEEISAGADRSLCWREAQGLPRDAKIIAFIGRMIPEKGVEPMVEAMAEIRRTCPDTWLIMAGGGPLLDRLRDHPVPGVIAAGVQPYEAVLALLQQSQLFCLPSRSEGFACTVLEAAALGCPIVTTATGGSPDLLISPEYGILLPGMEAGPIAEACIRALSDEGWRQKAADLAETRLKENFTWDAAVRQLLEAFDLEEVPVS